jgi:hypothetical protein
MVDVERDVFLKNNFTAAVLITAVSAATPQLSASKLNHTLALGRR